MSTKLEKLVQKKARLEAQIQKEKSKTKKQTRKDDTRRKILIGAVVMEKMKKDESVSKWVYEVLGTKLTRDNDRKLFILPPITK